MKVNRIFLVAGTIAMFTLASCGGGNKEKTQEEENTTQNTEQEQQDEEQQEVAAIDEMDFSRGKEIYNTQGKCITCHMENGQGVPGAFPPLANSDYLLENPKRAVAQVLNGSNEEMIVNGHTYTTPMEPQVDNYEDAVAVVNYILNTWGNDGGTISVEEVQDIEIVR